MESPSVKLNIFYGGVEDWVDKKGAERIRDRYPEKIKIKIV